MVFPLPVYVLPLLPVTNTKQIDLIIESIEIVSLFEAIKRLLIRL